MIGPIEDSYYFNDFFTLFSISKRSDVLEFNVSSYGTDLEHTMVKDFIYYDKMILQIQHLELKPKYDYERNKDGESCSKLDFIFKIQTDKKTLKDIIELDIKSQLIKLQKLTDLSLNHFTWLEEYETDEKFFSINLLQQLFSFMKFEKVIYNHGSKEFGKDFILSEFNKFGIEDYFGVQVKAGNVSGKVNSQIDELITQCEDAFSVPWENIKKEKFYINKFIIAISGRYSDNAKVKIQEKLPKSIRNHLIFLDKDLIISLVYKHIN